MLYLTRISQNKMVKRKNKDKFTIFIDKSLRDKYKEWCELKGYIPSRRIEIFIEEELERALKERKEAEDTQGSKERARKDARKENRSA